MSGIVPSDGQVATLHSGPLCVHYYKVADRLAHVIGLQISQRGEASFLPFLESIEGDASEPWPASPPMQHMVNESIGNNAAPVLLGVGQSGNGHWSSAVEPVEPNSLKFDIACKNSKPATYFGSRYRSLGNVLIDFENNAVKVVVRTGDTDLGLTFAVLMGRISIDSGNGILSIAPGSDPEFLQTHRWCYQFGFQN